MPNFLIDSLSSFLYFQMDEPLVKGEGKSWESLGLSARLKKGVERIREIKVHKAKISREQSHVFFPEV